MTGTLSGDRDWPELKGVSCNQLLQIMGVHVHSAPRTSPHTGPRTHNKTADLIDFFVSRNISINYIKIEKDFMDLNLDHSSIFLTIVFLDIEQPFDRVWHQGLINKVKSMHMHMLYLHIYNLYLTKRSYFNFNVP